MSRPRPPSAWHMTRRSRACASSTSACISSRLKAPSRGPWPALDRTLEADVEPGGVADHRVAGGERLLQHRGGAQMAGALRLVEAPAMLERVAVVRHMVMAIDQAGEHRLSRNIDDLRVARPIALVTGGDRRDPVVAKHDRCIVDRCGAGAVNQPAAFEDLHRLP